MKLTHATPQATVQHGPSPTAIELTAADFIPLPAKAFNYRGVNFTRPTAIRAIKSGRLKSRLFRQPGSVKGRRYILRESLDQYLAACMADVPLAGDEAITPP